MLTATEAAALADCSTSTVRKCANLPADNPRHLRGTKRERDWQFAHKDVRDWMERRKAYGPGRPTVGLPRDVAARMLGMSRQGLWHHITYGHLPREMTARDVVRFALSYQRRGMRWGDHLAWWRDEMWTLEIIKYGDYADHEYINYSSTLDDLCNAMEAIAPLEKWRVVKG